MRLEDKNRSLEQYAITDIPETDDTAQAANLLYDILNASYACSGTCLETEKNEERMTVQSIYWDVKHRLEKVCKNYEKTGFLAMSVIEDGYRTAKPLLLCPVSDLLDGDMSAINNARALEEILKENPYKQIWAKRESNYRDILQNLGFSTKDIDFSDLTEIMEPLLDALAFYDAGHNHIKQVRSGKKSGNTKPLIAKDIRLYGTEKDFVDALMALPETDAIAFAAVEKCNRQTADHFYEWYTGHPEEYVRNSMKYNHITKEELMERPNEWSRAIYTGIRCGENCYLVRMPWMSHQTIPGNEDYLYQYGKRASYAPYQIFFKKYVKEKDSTLPAVVKNRWFLSEVMDRLSMAWLPAFLDETIRYFYKTEKEPDAEPIRLREEGILVIPYQNGIRQLPAAIEKGLPAKTYSWTYHIKSPEDIFTSPNDKDTLDLIRYFSIEFSDISGAPLGPEKNGNPDKINGTIDEHTKKAYLKVLAERISYLLQGERRPTWRFMQSQLYEKQDSIIEKAAKGMFDDFLTEIVDKRPVCNPDGTYKMAKSDRYPYEQKVVYETTKKSDGMHDNINGRYRINTFIWWMGEKAKDGKPPVLWKIRPFLTEHYAKLLETGTSELPILLQLCDKIRNFLTEYDNTLPYLYSYRENGRYRLHDLSYDGILMGVPQFADINICMKRSVWKQLKKEYQKEM